ncbi:30S ribosomal protein S2-like [Rattus rattus]|uniref:30S ribosomal protein S2-like n=1 Tax=Rattus rattus TaxID=10117 RepID=UPI0013F31A0A|nr:30S ribosomal protein S2-like [Rattus rattus]
MAPEQQEENQLVEIETLETVEFNVGLYSKFWNPKMRPYISAKANGKYLFDTEISRILLGRAYQYILDLAGANADILLVGVKNKNTAPIIADAAKRVKTFHLTQRWLGGLLTNFKTISLNIKKLNYLETLLEDPEMQSVYTKKELIKIQKQKDKLEKFYGGIKNLNKLPELIILFNPQEDVTCLKEAKKMGIPVVALTNTNADPDLIEFPIPGNNTSMKSVYFVANFLCDAIAQAQEIPTLMAYKKCSEIEIPEEYSYKPKTHERGHISFI